MGNIGEAKAKKKVENMTWKSDQYSVFNPSINQYFRDESAGRGWGLEKWSVVGPIVYQSIGNMKSRSILQSFSFFNPKEQE